MQLITLITDWGQKDWYNGKIKSALYSKIKDADVIDINHNINKFDLRSAAFVIKNSCLDFPEGTIHIIDVNTYEDKDKSFIVVKYNGQFFICTDNGLPSMVFEDKEVAISDLSNVLSDSNYYTFAVLDVFINVVKQLSETHSMSDMGNMLDNFSVKKYFPQASIFPDSIACQVVYIDDYGNAYLNIDDVTFTKALNGRDFELRVDTDCTITRVSSSYQDATLTGKALLTVSSTHNLELAVREDNFSRLLGYEIGTKVIINIK